MQRVEVWEPNMDPASPGCIRTAGLRRGWRLRAAILAACLLAGTGTALGQTCDVPQAPRMDPMQVADTCTGDQSITSLCNGEVAIQGPVGVWSFRVGAGATGILELLDAGMGFSPVGYLVAADGACGEGACQGYVDPLTPLDLAGVAPGDYHLMVTASAWDAPGACGSYMLSLSGSLGGSDDVFADGFD